jgi:sec-independent protein translocase protein TatC
MISPGRFRPLRMLNASVRHVLKRKALREETLRGVATNAPMTFLEHVQDLRRHVVRAAIWLVVLSGLCFFVMDELIAFLKIPYNTFLLNNPKNFVGSSNLTSIGVFEVMTINVKLCFLAGFTLSLPLMLWELWKFVSPALFVHEKRIARIALFSSVLLFYSGLCFGFFLIIPYFFSGALSWASHYASVMITYQSYFNTLMTMLLIFAAIFEVPVVLTLLGFTGIVPSAALAKNRRIAFLSCFIIGALLAPPDVVSMCLVACPLYAMVEISIWLIKRIEKGRI